MSDQDKAPFERVAEERKRVYEKAMAVYNENVCELISKLLQTVCLYYSYNTLHRLKITLQL